MKAQQNKLQYSSKVIYQLTCNHTIGHFLWQLVVFHKWVHVAIDNVTDDALHVNTVLTQPKVKISKPEDLVESCRDIGCKCKVWDGYWSVNVTKMWRFIHILNELLLIYSGSHGQKWYDNTA